MTSKIIVNTIEADTGISSVTFASNINLQNDSSVLVSSSGIRLGTGSTIAAPSANEITLSTNSAERFRIDSAGRMLLGTTTEGEANADTLTIAESGNAGITIRSGSSATGSIYFSDATSGGGEYDGWIAYNQNSRYFQFGTAQTERLRIDSSGFIKQKFTSNNSTTAEGLFINNLNNGTGNNASLILSNDSGERKKAAIALIDTGNYGAGDLVFALDGADSGELHLTNDEKLRITSGGTILVNSTIDNTGGHGQIVAHAPLSGDTIYKAIEIGNTDGNGTARGAAICGQPKSNSHLPYTLIGSWDHGDNTDVYYGGGWGGAMRPATRHRFYTNSSYPTSGTSGTERMRILNNGHVNIGDGYLNSVTNSGLHVGRSSGGTAAGESVLAATLGNDSTMVSALLTVKNAGNRGSQGNGSGSPLAKFEFNNGTAFEIDKYGRRTLPYQPAFFVYKATSTWALAANDVFVFDTAELNVGGHYNTTNGRFTAPITARYVFHFFSIYTGNATGDSIEMYKNGARMYGGDVHFTNSVGGNWDTVHYSRVIQLSSGDYVHMQTRTGHTFHGNHWGGWSGYMLG